MLNTFLKIKRRAVALSALLLFSLIGFSQSGYFYHATKSSEKYFVALGYGFGTARWNSVFKSTEFYDKDGAVINMGDLKFSANSPTRNYDVNVMAPIGRIRFGLGIDFEFHYLAQLKIYTKEGEDYLLFDEGLRFDKIYLQAEVPFAYDTDKKYSFSWNTKLGWFGYTNVKRFNFLGEKPFPTSLLASSGIVADYEVYPRVYAYVLPNLEYKFYDNSGLEAPVDIRHSVFSASILCGIRVDLGRFYN
ncbi:MAG: hypothetical protein EPN85_10360 [Bacteroidetes bacterium]|nr:MAG: hypothetical protein EPN85_10360 [Bacteroidota bacterium]